MPIPMLDVIVTYKDGTKSALYGIENDARRKTKAETDDPRIQHADWPWTHPTYEFSSVDRPISEILSVEIDPSGKNGRREQRE